jgi:uncharacterized membrane-anchored protein YhcB (DUF1043 family)
MMWALFFVGILVGVVVGVILATVAPVATVSASSVVEEIEEWRRQQ